MLLWAGFVLLIVGLGCVGVDRQAAHHFYDNLSRPFWRFLERTTHLAKAGHWLVFALFALAAAQLFRGSSYDATAQQVFDYVLAFIVSLALGSILLHGTKLLLGRRRPRDDLEMKLYGFIPLAFNLEHNSFPSGHALTIMCVAVIASSIYPAGAPLWFAIAIWLGLTRAFLAVHFLSDVLVGAGLGLIITREVLLQFFPHLPPHWF